MRSVPTQRNAPDCAATLARYAEACASYAARTDSREATRLALTLRQLAALVRAVEGPQP